MSTDKRKRIAVYAGTFDPITKGHKDIAERASTLFDLVIVAIVRTPSKQTLFKPEERLRLAEETLQELRQSGKVEVKLFSGLLVHYAKELGAQVIIRGLRAVSDYDYEAQLALLNRRLVPEIETVFLMTSEHCSFVSSSVVREIAQNGGDVDTLVTANVAEYLRRAIKKP